MAGVKGALHSNMATAMAIAGRASRACDVCGSQRARWYCEADNAHLCHRCDQSVHSANALARRHERVRLTPHGTTATTSQAAKKQQPDSKSHHKAQHPRPSPQTHSLPSRKRSRLSRRPNPHAHAPAEAHPAKPHQRRNPKAGRGAAAGAAHEVPNFITVNIQESPISFTHDSATAMSMAEFCKERAAAAMASAYVDVDTYEELSSGDSGPDFLVPSGYLDDFESAIDAPIEGTPSPFDEDNSNEMENNDIDSSFMGDALDLNCGSDGHYEDYPLDFSDIVGLRDGDAFEGDCGETSELVDEGDAAAAADGDEARHLEQQHAVVPFPCKVKHEYNAVSGGNNCDFVKKEIAALLRNTFEGEDAKPAPSLLRLNYEDVLSAWSDRSLWTDGKRPQTVPDDSTSEATVG